MPLFVFEIPLLMIKVKVLSFDFSFGTAVIFACSIRDPCQVLLLVLSEFNGINSLIFSLKSSENLWFPDHFRGNRS